MGKKIIFQTIYTLFLIFKILYAVNMFYFRLFSSLSAGKFMTGRIIISLNTTLIVQIQEGTKLFAVVEEWKIHGMKYCIQ